ncbi:uncharacterized protein [Nothobranchius furzeri]|uniref:uncharacterized protein isoform X3 n=1 Tax=Nothobranchius furzeri TaxID=105023 RepID=UPI002403A896|nr:uncharacterized protein LOC107390574 isoform X3 [Nothobranchius furzeri]
MDSSQTDKKRATSPTQSTVSAQSYGSKDEPLNFRNAEQSGPNKQRPTSPTQSTVSAQSSRSKDEPLNFRNAEQSGPNKQRPTSPTQSTVSAQSSRSKDEPLNFRNPEQSGPNKQRPTSPTQSTVSAQSSRSKDEPLNFRNAEQSGPNKQRPTSPTQSTVSVQSSRSKDEPLNFRNAEQSEPNKQRPTSPTQSTVSAQSSRSKDEPLNFRNAEQSGPNKQRLTSPTQSTVSAQSSRSKDEPLNFRNPEQSGPNKQRPTSPTQSTVSAQSSRSKDEPLNFRNAEQSEPNKQRPTSPTQSTVSAQSSRSKDEPLNFRNAEQSGPNKQRPTSLTQSTVSAQSSRSKDEPLNFRNPEQSGPNKQRPTSPTQSTVSAQSSRSKDEPLNFRNPEQSGLNKQRPTSPTQSTVSAQSSRSKAEPLNFRNAEQSGPNKQRPTSPTQSTVSAQSSRSKDEPLNFRNAQQSGPKKQRPTSPTQSTVSAPNSRSNRVRANATLREIINATKSEIHGKPKLKDTGRKKVLSLYKTEVDQVQTDTELYKTDKNKEPEGELIKSYKDLFADSNNAVRTVLTRGVAGIGKTFQSKLFMVEWANQKSNKDIDIILPLQFDEMNVRREAQSMEDLLNNFFSDAKGPRFSIYDECKVAFVLDGLENCELPLNFKNSDVKDIKEKVSMDVLLTNLIKGNLLPKALLWIISQPSGVQKIPSEYISKITECRETKERRKKLALKLKKRVVKENKHIALKDEVNHPNQKNTEHIIRGKPNDEGTENGKHETTQLKSLTRVKDPAEIFKDENEKKIRTVLTIGEADVGKSYLMQKFITAWCKSDSQRSYFSPFLSWLSQAETNEDILFHFDFLKFNAVKKEKFSLVGLLNHFFAETKHCVISDYTKFNIVFVLDGLEAFQPPLNFDNNEILTDVREPASVDVLLTNLIRGNLLPSAKVWITSRSSADEKRPDIFDRLTEIREKPDITSHKKLKIQLKERFTHVCEGIDQQKISVLLNEIYTDLYIIEGERGDVNTQHEIKQVQDAKFKPAKEEKSIKYCDIFRLDSDNKPIKTVLTIGVAGIGKTFASVKYILDWAESVTNGDYYYIFPLPFRELNLRKEEEHSFEDLLHQFFPAMKTSEITDYDKYKILIILDGFDECRLDLKFNENDIWKDVKKPKSVSVLLSNLIQGHLLPEAQIWITSRPAASNSIPAETVDRLTEVRGFNDEQKEEYFRKRYSDKELAENIWSNVKKSRSIYIMCHIPLFCWITSKVMEDFNQQNEEIKELPKTLTDMYTHFLLLQCRQANVKYDTEEDESSQSCWNTRNKETVLSLGKLAFEALERGDLLFTEENLTDYGIDVTKAVVFSGLFTQIKREEHGVYQHKLFCFVHLSIQEFLAALYVSHSFSCNGDYLFIDHRTADSDLPASEFYKEAVDKATASEHGRWDLFLRFLLGLFVKTNQDLLQELIKRPETYEMNYKETVEYIKTKTKEDTSDPDENLNLFHCLNELNDHSLVNEIKTSIQSEKKEYEQFTHSQWSALTFVLLTSDETLEVFDLKKYLKSEKVLLGMLPVVRVSKSALLSWCELSEESCHGLTSSVLKNASSNLTDLDLSHNDLLDSGVEQLAEGLKSRHCKLEALILSGCQVTEKGCDFLASALKSNKASNLKKLDLSYNHPGENGMRVLNDVAADSHWKLETIRFDHDGPHRLKPGLKKYGADLKHCKQKTCSAGK